MWDRDAEPVPFRRVDGHRVALVGQDLAEHADRGIVVVVLHRPNQTFTKAAIFLGDQMRHRDRQWRDRLEGITAHEIVGGVSLAKCFAQRTGRRGLVLADEVGEPSPDHRSGLGHEVPAD